MLVSSCRWIVGRTSGFDANENLMIGVDGMVGRELWSSHFGDLACLVLVSA